MSAIPIGNRTVEIFPPGPAGPVIFESMTASEALGRPFEIEVDLLSPTGEIPVSEVLGQPFSVALSQGLLSPPRWWNGLVTRFAQVAWTGAAYRFRATLRPTLWLMTRRSNCRIFQNTTIPDLVIDLLAARGVLVKKHLGRASYPSWEYLVQYNETDFDFVSRLMELEGIFYYFVHDKGQHTLWLVDALTVPDKIAGSSRIPFATTGERALDPWAQHEMIDEWSAALQVEPGAFVAMEYDFEDPRNELKSTLVAPRAPSTADYELFEYPGHYLDTPERDDYVERRLEERQLDPKQVQGTGNARALAPGFLFTLAEHPAPSQNRAYLVTAASYRLTATQHVSGGGDAGPDYRCAFTAIDGKRRYRPPLVTPKPSVPGPQTALVVGPKGEEIWTDRHGRVRVQFHWDRKGNKDERSSRLVRVSQVWAGSGWGAIHIPRIGQEVIVDFLDGDPDRPIITGRVYNGANMPPYTLPDNKTQSGIKSHSTPGGGPANFNEIRFEDAKGKEELHIQAEKDQTTLVKNNQTITVGVDRTVNVGGNESTSVTGTRSATVTKKETQTFEDARAMTVAQTDTVTVTGKHTGTYDGGRAETVSRGDTLTVQGSDKTTTVHGKYDITADAEFQVTQGASKLLIKDSVDVDSVGEIHLHNSQSSVDLKDGVLTISSANEIVLACGTSRISIRKDGTIELDGPQMLKATGGGGGAGIELTQPGATVTGTKATLTGHSLTEITGGIVKIN
jgi:type VI secretion system secreted protein VgrG